MDRFCLIAVRMLSTLLVLLIFVLGRIPDAAYAQASYGYQHRTGQDGAHHPTKKHHLPRHKHSRRLVHSKNFQIKLSTPQARITVTPVPAPATERSFNNRPTYSYLFFREINPPPPRLG